jgi:hypothetical protein
MPPLHTLNLYQKPKLGTAFISRMPVYNYRHSINAIGGFDTASCDIAVRSRDEGQQFLDQYLGNRIAFYVDNPVEPIWEGYINRMTFSAGGVQYTIGLDEMANRVAIQYAAAGAVTTTETTISNDTNSQAVYGIKQSTFDAGPQLTAGTGITTAFRGTILAQRAWPKTSILPSGGGANLLHIECLGFYHTLVWEEYRDANNALNQINQAFTLVLLPALANGTTFFDNTDFTDIATNTSTINRNSARGETMWDRLRTLAEMGDGTSYYVMGITTTLFSTGLRRMYYRAASSTVVYTARQSDGLRIRNLYGQLVDPWRVRPDAGIRVSDMLIGWNGVGDNPTETYILKIDYDANRQSCIYSGDDDLSAEGVFNLKRMNKVQKGGVGGAGRRLV